MVQNYKYLKIWSISVLKNPENQNLNKCIKK